MTALIHYILSPFKDLIALFLLWKNPEKYKEYEMKQLRKLEKEKTKGKGRKTND